MSRVYPAVKALIQKGDKFLIVKHLFQGKTDWSLPGGKVNYGELPYDSLAREIKEELSVSIKIIEPCGMFWFFRYDGDQIVCTTFLCSMDDDNIDLTNNPTAEKITEYRWVTKEEFLNDEYPVLDESIKTMIASF